MYTGTQEFDIEVDGAPLLLAGQLHDAPEGVYTTLPDGRGIKRHDKGYIVFDAVGREIAFYRGDSYEHAKRAALCALDESAHSRHPASVGGEDRYHSYSDYIRVRAGTVETETLEPVEATATTHKCRLCNDWIEKGQSYVNAGTSWGHFQCAQDAGWPVIL